MPVCASSACFPDCDRRICDPACVSPPQNAIREKNQALQFLKLASRLEGVCSRLEAASKMNQLTESMKGVVTGMDAALKEMNTDKVHICVRVSVWRIL